MEGGAGRQEGLGGMTLGAVLEKEKDMPLRVNHRTLLDIIRQEEPNCRVYENLIDHRENNKGWNFFKDRRRTERSLDGDVWAAGVPVPVSDVAFSRDLVSTSNAVVMGAGRGSSPRPPLAQLLRNRSVCAVEQVQEDDESGEVAWAETGQVPSSNQNRLARFFEQVLEDDDSGEVPWAGRGQLQPLNQNDVDRRNSLHIEHVPVSDVPVSIENSLSSLLMGNLSPIPLAERSAEPVRSIRLSEALAAEREHMQMAVSSTEAARSGQDEAEVTETNNRNEEQDEIGAEATNELQGRMSLMDLLEDNDSRQMGWSSYIGDVDYNDEGNDYVEEEGSNFVEQNCCICMVRHKGSAFIPCGHTFCRLCSRELWVNRGNCPICNGFILEILDIF